LVPSFSGDLAFGKETASSLPDTKRLVNNKRPLTMHSRAACLRRLTYFTDPVCTQISVQDFTATSAGDLKQRRSSWASVVAMAAVQGGSVPLPSDQGCA